MTKKVVIFGGGIAGLTAAHELIERNYLGEKYFDVELYDGGPGSKANSQFIPGTARGPRSNLPGEHGFRYFPAYYWHIVDTMSRIPTADGKYVSQHLLGCEEFALVSSTRGVIPIPRQPAPTISTTFKVATVLKAFFKDLGVSPLELGRFALSMLGYMCTCDKRRLATHENRAFWSFVEGHRYSPLFQSYINAPRFMVAMQAKRGSARTIGNQVVQLLLDSRRPRGTADRVLDGPTSTTWLNPWIKYLTTQGVRIKTGQKLLRLEMEGARIKGAVVEGEREPVVADYYVCAIPAEQMIHCISDEMAARDGKLAYMRHDAITWLGHMSGAQFFLRDDVRVVAGHAAYPDSAWGLTSIAPVQFWNRRKNPADLGFQMKYGDGTSLGFLSVDISDWETESPRLKKSLSRCTNPKEVLDEVWRQLQDGLNANGALLEDGDLVHAHLDSNIVFDDRGARSVTPLLVHPPGSWNSRPQATGAIENLFLAGDYVQTSTDLATMEGANESARIAVNAILGDAGLGPFVEVRPLAEDAGPVIAELKRRDAEAIEKGDQYESVAQGDLTIDQVELLEEELAKKFKP